MIRTVCLLILICPTVLFAQQKTRDDKVREDRAKVESEGFWIYNDLAKGLTEAKQTGKPLLVVLRCIPCEECVKLDDDLVDQDPAIQQLLQKFVCVRQVSTNGLDLATFQYDTDQSFAVFMLNADGTIYGRFGTRSHRTEWFGDVSLTGMAKALQGALELHADYPNNKESLAGKHGPKPLYPSPEKFPSLKDKYTDSLNYSGNVVRSCIHCHQIGDARRDYYRSRNTPMPQRLIFPYPHPKSVGLILDPKEKATITKIVPDSPADRSGFRSGDEILTLDNQPLLSMADVQWVLEQAPPAGGNVSAVVLRDGKRVNLTLELAAGWRRADDISWRVSSWGYRRMATGGMLLAALPAEERQEAGLTNPKQMALKVEHLGQYGAHAAAKKAGFKKGDVLVEFDGRTNLLREADLFERGLTKLKPGDKVRVTVLRDGKRVDLKLPMQL